MQTSEERIYKVAELAQLLKLTLETQFAQIAVLGEASGVVLASSGHLYFTLKDAAGAMKVAMFRGALQRSTLKRLENGQQVVVRGMLSVYPLRGELQIIASDIRLQGIGDIFAALEKLKKAYQEKGYFDPQRKKPLPLLPGRIGVVTSPTGAAVRDIVRILRRRFPGIAVVIYPARVQGEGAAEEIAAGVDYFNGTLPPAKVDVLIVGRGGGSYEDLWAFNEAPVVEAIFRSRVPVISAVGHETDFTIADFVADLRAATPSAAAELVVGKKDEFLSRIQFLRQALMRPMERELHERRSALARLRGESALADFPGRLQSLAQRLDNGEFSLVACFRQSLSSWTARMNTAVQGFAACDMGGLLRNRALRLQNLGLQAAAGFQQGWQRRRERLRVLDGRLAGMNPESILAKGYSITTDSRQQVVRDAAALAADELIRIRFARGGAAARVVKE
ncbi:MAG: exodeoxyribonuclease VII large subunit [Acidobacteria bacterium]|jgi:exodeoxyribonuclease VII large subunit|nr:exodeoxyribonuclease VII large subunit [Acidobacteriota bacterium]